VGLVVARSVRLAVGTEAASAQRDGWLESLTLVSH